jgi:phosphoketolase
MTIPKNDVVTAFTPKQAAQLVEQGALTLDKADGAQVQLVAVGAYQLGVCQEVKRALAKRDIQCRITYLLEPGRFRQPRDLYEQTYVSDVATRISLFPDDIRLRFFVSHLRPEILLGVCRPLDLGVDRCIAFGYRNQGGTLDTPGLLRANQSDARSIATVVMQQINRGEA